MDAPIPRMPPPTAWSDVSLHRLHRLLALAPEAAPAELTPLEALALLEWSRMAVYADCHAAGAGDPARTMLREALRR
ncbi:MAG: hypothetical protein IT340_12420 [Chloroflexi bacterium]|nr:hypothetical protein [Chloroflexota bacterium]